MISIATEFSSSSTNASAHLAEDRKEAGTISTSPARQVLRVPVDVVGADGAVVVAADAVVDSHSVAADST